MLQLRTHVDLQRLGDSEILGVSEIPMPTVEFDKFGNINAPSYCLSPNT